MMTDERMYQINFHLMRKFGAKGKNPYSLKGLSEQEIRDLAAEIKLFSKEEIEEFIPRFFKEMES